MSVKLKALTLLPILIATSACPGSGTPAPQSASDSYCLIAEPFTYHAPRPGMGDPPESAENMYDTPELIDDVKGHNSEYACTCNDDCPEED